MFCHNCGASVLDGVTFCSSCGKLLNVPPTVETLTRPKKSSKVVIFGGGFIIVVLLLGLIGKYSQPTDEPQASQFPASSTAAAATTSAQWVKVKTWRGSGIKQTENFAITGGKWRISWSAQNEPLPGAGVLQIMVYNEAGEMVSLAGNKQGPGGDVSYIYTKPGNYHLMINSANIDWGVEVEEPQ